MNTFNLAGKNLVLIGMPGVGKSTIGVLLAKELSRSFLDTDVFIQSQESRRLREIIRDEGMNVFRALEERYILTLDCREHVIATGGSVVYSPAAMEHLRSDGVLVHLSLPIEVLETRVSDLKARGVVCAEGQSLPDLYSERMPLYARYSNAEVDCAGMSHEQVVSTILRLVN
ncbi:MAG: shikimate kinase [Candidatus Hydrogenedentes bacterium]|nr:shikimate kinase [Candidatus Hydrogenedentota bacterium]